MNESLIIFQFAVATFCLFVGSVLYSMGGYRGKWKRRFLGSLILAGGFNAICAWRGVWAPWQILAWGITIGAFCLPYGAKSLVPKILKRSAVVAAMCLTGVLFAIQHGGNAWWVLIPHAGMGAWSVYLGVKNPIQARAEEGFVCILLSLGLFMYPFS